MNVSKRICKAVELMEPGYRLADIGCDHAYLSILAINRRIFGEAFACDIHEGPLERAAANIRSAGLEDRIHTVLSDGFSALKPGFDCAVICGMGGILIRDILERDKNKVSECMQLILGPQSELPELRSWLQNSAWQIYRETVVSDAGKFYILMDVRKNTGTSPINKNDLNQTFLFFGDPAKQQDIEEYRNYLADQKKKLFLAVSKVLSGCSLKSLQRKAELEEQIILLDGLVKSL